MITKEQREMRKRLRPFITEDNIKLYKEPKHFMYALLHHYPNVWGLFVNSDPYTWKSKIIRGAFIDLAVDQCMRISHSKYEDLDINEKVFKLMLPFSAVEGNHTFGGV